MVASSSAVLSTNCVSHRLGHGALGAVFQSKQTAAKAKVTSPGSGTPSNSEKQQSFRCGEKMVDSWTWVSEIFIQLSFSNMSICLLTVYKPPLQ